MKHLRQNDGPALRRARLFLRIAGPKNKILIHRVAQITSTAQSSFPHGSLPPLTKCRSSPMYLRMCPPGGRAMFSIVGSCLAFMPSAPWFILQRYFGRIAGSGTGMTAAVIRGNHTRNHPLFLCFMPFGMEGRSPYLFAPSNPNLASLAAQLWGRNIINR